MKSVFVTGYALCLFPTSCVFSDSQDCSCLRRAGSRSAPCLLHMKSVFVTGYALCHLATSCVFPRRCVLFVCLFEVVRALCVSFRIRSRASGCAKLAPTCVCPAMPVRPCLRLLVQVCSMPAPCLLHMKSVFVTGYALCLFPTSCVFPRRCVLFVCLFEAADEAAHPHPRTSAHAVRGPVSRPPLYPTNGPNVTACRTRSPKLQCLPTPSDAVACSTGS